MVAIETEAERVAKGAEEQVEEMIRRLRWRTLAMVDFAAKTGKAVPKDVLVSLERASLDAADAGGPEEIVTCHNLMAEVVAPATPSGIDYLRVQENASRGWRYLGPVPTIRAMALASLGLLAAFIWASAQEAVRPENIDVGFLYLTDQGRWLVALFYLSAAGLGASFANLFKAYRYVREGSFDPRLSMTYWVRLILGMTAGFLLAEIVPLDVAGQIDKPLLAVLGGFSAEAVHSILARMVQALESIVQGDMKALVAAREAHWKARQQSSQAAANMALVNQLAAARQDLEESGDPKAAREALDKLIKAIIARIGPIP